MTTKQNKNNKSEQQVLMGIVPSIFMYIGLTFATVFSFMGLIYALRGNIPIATFLSLIILVALMALAYFLVKYKTKPRGHENKKPEYVMLAAYAVIFSLIFPICFHFVDIEFSRKDALKQQAIDKLNDLQTMKNEYRRSSERAVNSFKDSVDATLNSYFVTVRYEIARPRTLLTRLLQTESIDFARYERNPNDPRTKEMLKKQIERVRDERAATIKANHNLGDLTNEFNDFFTEAMPVFTNWNRLKISYYYSQTDEIQQKMRNSMKQRIPNFSYQGTSDVPIQLDAISVSFAQASIIKIVAIMLLLTLLHACILMPYIFADRANYGGLIRKAGKQETLEGNIDL
ncbi:MAG: hypothetical protein JJT94_08025 [Bernardetiaceae bacterium]|nr:hypothetical protein [Bernardetiaceae bacterium]